MTAAFVQATIACPDCDLLLPQVPLPVGGVARCPRCGAVLYRHKRNSINRTLAFSLAGLILFIPAVLLPVMTFEIAGNATHNSLLLGVVMLWQQGYWWMAGLVLLCSVIFPVIELMMLLFIAVSVRWRKYSALLCYLTRKTRIIASWGMLDVYMLGILVAMIKMGDLGDILAGPALWAFIALLVCSIASAAVFDANAVWRFVESYRSRR